jgi:integrase
MARNNTSFRVGSVQAYLRGRIWYLCYHENGKRRRPRVGPDREVARQLASQTNAQLELGAPAVLSFEPIAVSDLRDRWLSHHELVLRSSVATISRYRTATNHLLNFLHAGHHTRVASQFHAIHAEEFVRYLRTIVVAPNGHPHARKRPLLDKGIKYILESCQAMFAYALKRRHLSPYAENPFSVLEIDRIPIEEARLILLLSRDQERAFLETCDDWQFPLFLTLLLTGLRPGELAHLLVEDLELEPGILRVRNRPELGWQVKTRNEREIPLVRELALVLRRHLGCRTTGPVFRRRDFSDREQPLLEGCNATAMAREVASRMAQREAEVGLSLKRVERLALARAVWRDAGLVREDWIRQEFLRITQRIGLPSITAPKVFRHQFATMLQAANVDPLVRNELMGHSPVSARGRGLGMTAVYTHTRPETRREQLEFAVKPCPAIEVAKKWLTDRESA